MLIFFMQALLPACVTLYKPNVVQSPLLSRSGEGNLELSLGLSGSGTYNLQGSYAVNDKVALMVNGMGHRRDADINSGKEKLRIYSGEGGLGSFKTFGTKGNGLLQLYGGTGLGRSNARMVNYPNSVPEVTANYQNFFMQPGIALNNPHFKLAFDLRANYVRVYNINANLYDQFEWWNTDFQFVKDTSISFLNLEPVITIKAGGESLKFLFQTGLTIPVVNPDSYFAVNNSDLLILPLFRLSAGISYSFGYEFGKKSPESIKYKTP